MAATATPTKQIPDREIKLTRRTIDTFLISVGAVMTAALLVAGLLLNWGASFSDDYVYDELSSQRIFFSDEESLRAEGRDDLVRFAGQQVTTGEHAEAYASFINGHLQNMAGGMTYSEIGVPQGEARTAWQAAVADGADDETVAELKAEYDALTNTRDSLFKGETLRGLLLSAFAWSTVGQIAGYAAVGAFIAAAVMFVLVILGVINHRKLAPARS